MRNFFQFLGLFTVFATILFSSLLSSPNKVQAAEFKFKTGYYVAKGAEETISNIGFEPDFVMIKNYTSIGGVLKHKDMPANTVMYMTGTTTDTNTQITLNEDGFSVGGSLNAVGTNGTLYYWIAVGGSDCSATGTLCVSSYLGNGGGARDIDVGFEPGTVIVKPHSAALNFRTASFAANMGSYFDTSSNITNGNLHQSFAATGFRVGTTNNQNAVAYYYIAFAAASEKFFEGVFTGNAADNRNITDPGVRPDFLFIKNTTTSGNAVFRINKMFGDLTGYIGNSIGATVNLIQDFLDTGFQVGSNSTVNQNTNNIHYFGLLDEEETDVISGTFDMNIGTYTGNGTTLTVSNVGFNPSMLISKGSSYATYNTRVSGTGFGFYKGVSSNSITSAGITLGINEFTVGNSFSAINNNNVLHYWQAFSNAYNPYDFTGAEDFAMGAYLGNGQNNREINDLPFEPDFVFIKALTASTNPNWRTSNDASGVTNFFSPTSSVSSDYIVDFTDNGFRIGTNNSVNSNSGATFTYYAFKLNPNFQFGTYTGNSAVSRDVTIGANFQPDLLWVSATNATAGVMKTSNMSGIVTPSLSTGSINSAAINSIGYNTMNIGNGASVNTNAVTYYWLAFNSKEYNQANYRFFENEDSTLIGAPLEAENTEISFEEPGQNFRLRMIVDVEKGNLLSSGLPLKLQVAKKGTGSCASPQFSYADVTSTSAIAFYDNPSTADKAQLTTSANDPTSANTLTTQQYIESNNFTNSFAAINDGQSGIFDFSLVDYAEIPNNSYCFRMVYADNDRALDTYENYPVVTIEGDVPPAETSVTFSISNNNLGFGTIDHETTKYATNDGLGTITDNTDALTISASTNASNGYKLSVSGTTMTCSSCSSFFDIDAIGSVAEASAIGTEQFGLRLIKNSGTGSVSSPFNTANWAFDPGIGLNEIASGDGDEVESVFGVRFIVNAEELTAGGDYQSDLQFVMTANF